jgi:hypothetical protein
MINSDYIHNGTANPISTMAAKSTNRNGEAIFQKY